MTFTSIVCLAIAGASGLVIAAYEMGRSDGILAESERRAALAAKRLAESRNPNGVPMNLPDTDSDTDPDPSILRFPSRPSDVRSSSDFRLFDERFDLDRRATPTRSGCRAD
jgi:hypothetical protein